MLASMFGGCGKQKFDDLLGTCSVQSKHKSGKWSERVELVLGRSMDLLAVADKQV
jgi:hypothetical protein